MQIVMVTLNMKIETENAACENLEVQEETHMPDEKPEIMMN